MSAVRRILIIKMSAMGDILHALPVSAALGEAYPHVELTWAVEEGFASLLDGNPYLSHVLTLPKLRGRELRSRAFRKDYIRRLKDVRHRGFDLTLDLQGLTKSAIVAAASGAKRRLGYHWLREAARMVETPVPQRPESVHIVDQYLDVARFLGAEPNPVRFPFGISAEDEAYVVALLYEQGIDVGTPYVAVNPASALAIKQWGARNYAELMDACREQAGLPSVLVTADKAVAEEVAREAKQPFVNLVGKTSLKQLAAVLKRSAVHVCGDTGSGHLAAALGRPVIALIGPTDPDRACPYGQRANVLSHRERCGPHCTWHKCEFEHPRCLNAISAPEVLERVVSLVHWGLSQQD